MPQLVQFKSSFHYTLLFTSQKLYDSSSAANQGGGEKTETAANQGGPTNNNPTDNVIIIIYSYTLLYTFLLTLTYKTASPQGGRKRLKRYLIQIVRHSFT
jgi:hypothetical protein